MEGTRSNTQPSDLLKKIKVITRSILEDICSGRSPSLYIDRFRNYCTDVSGNCFCSFDLSIGQEILILQRECHACRLDVLLRVLLIVQQLLQENRHGSKRDIYYMHPSVFQEQSVVDRAINDICILLHCSRHNLNVVSVGTGLVMGWLRFHEAERKFDCISSLNTPQPVPVHVEDVKDLVSVAHYILVVEKESVFQRLANDQFCNKNRCIVITGRGYPDVPTRRFLRLLMEKLSLPAYCLVDCDPYGFDILMTYRFGSMQMAYDAKFLRLPEIHWLGVFPSDGEKYGIPQQCHLPLTAEDKSRTEAMLLRCYLQREVPHWRSELELLLQRGVKFEIEALSSCVFEVNINCEACKTKLYDVLRSISGEYSVTIDTEEGLAKVSGEVDPTILLSAIGKSSKHAELKWVQLKSPTPQNRSHYYHNDDMGKSYGPYSISYGQDYYGYGGAIEPPHSGRRALPEAEGRWCDTLLRYCPVPVPVPEYLYNYSLIYGYPLPYGAH